MLIVIFDESRHQQPTLFGDTYNLMYYLLIYFTNDWMAMLLLFLGLFITLEAVLIRKEDPENWRHVFRIIYYGFGDASVMNIIKSRKNKTSVVNKS